MIKSYKNQRLERFHKGEKVRGLRGLDKELPIDRLDLLHAISAISDVPKLKSLNLHRLKGGRSGHWTMNINGPWRLVFEWRDGHAYDVELIDYHKG
jgi:proteic killer suppression protein